MSQKPLRPYTKSEVETYTNFFNQLNRSCRGSAEDHELIEKAFKFAESAHAQKWQRRKMGDPYIIHPLRVAKILAAMNRDAPVIAAGIMHDVLEDTDVKADQMLAVFGEEVTELVEAVSSLDESLPEFREMTHKELDTLSDGRLLEQAQMHPEAIYIKAADRLNNLSDINETFPFHKRKAKVDQTRMLLIQLLLHIGANLLAAELEERCFRVENPEAFDQIHQAYNQLYSQNLLAIQALREYLPGERESGEDAQYYWAFSRRFNSELHNEILNQVSEKGADVPSLITKENVALADIYLVVRGKQVRPLDTFFKIYPQVRDGMLEPNEERRLPVHFYLTVMDTGKDSLTEAKYLTLMDRYSNRYRLFCVTEEEYRRNRSGSSQRKLIVRSFHVNPAEPAESFMRNIRVFLRNGKPMDIQYNATVLDLAFALHSEVGLNMLYAKINHKADHLAPGTRLSSGDQVEIVTAQEPQAKLRWFEYVRCQGSIKKLTHYFEGYGNPKFHRSFLVAGRDGSLDIEADATVLDAAFLVDGDRALHLKGAYINKSRQLAGIDHPVGAGDRLEFVYQEETLPQLGWFMSATTEKARVKLVQYFSQKTGMK